MVRNYRKPLSLSQLCSLMLNLQLSRKQLLQQQRPLPRIFGVQTSVPNSLLTSLPPLFLSLYFLYEKSWLTSFHLHVQLQQISEEAKSTTNLSSSSLLFHQKKKTSLVCPSTNIFKQMCRGETSSSHPSRKYQKNDQRFFGSSYMFR